MQYNFNSEMIVGEVCKKYNHNKLYYIDIIKVEIYIDSFDVKCKIINSERNEVCIYI